MFVHCRPFIVRRDGAWRRRRSRPAVHRPENHVLSVMDTAVHRIRAGRPHGDPYGTSLRPCNYLISPVCDIVEAAALRRRGYPRRHCQSESVAAARRSESEKVWRIRTPRPVGAPIIGRPLCAEGIPKRHCQFEFKGAQRHLNPSYKRRTAYYDERQKGPSQMRRPLFPVFLPMNYRRSRIRAALPVRPRR